MRRLFSPGIYDKNNFDWLYYLLYDYIILFSLSFAVFIGINMVTSPFADVIFTWQPYAGAVSVAILGSIALKVLRDKRIAQNNFRNQLLNSLEEVEETKSYFETLVQQTPSVIEIYDKDGLQISVNKAYEKLWSFPANTTLRKFNILHSKEVLDTDLIIYVKRAYAGETVQVPEYEFDPSGESESNGFGRKRWLSTRIFPLKDRNGEVKNIVVTHEDISERKYSEDEIIKAKEKAIESDRLKTVFLANMSHEIRTPMNGIMGFAELLRNPNLVETKQHKYVDIIKSSGDRMLTILNDLIDISQIESGQVKLNNEEFSCAKVMVELYNFFLPEAKNKDLALVLLKDQEFTSYQINCDKQKITQMISNLLSNALKYTEAGVIKFGFTPKQKGIEFFVSDTGLGIEAEKQKLIFDRFHQLNKKALGNKSGVGLGLSICKAYTDLMGGEITIESEPDIGSTFRLWIPNQTTKANVKKYIQPVFSMERFMHQKLSILIVEDDEVSFEFFKEFMGKAPIKIFYARTGFEAVRLAVANDEIDLILMDIKLPEMDGLEAIKKIKKVKPFLPILVQTAFVTDTDIDKAYKAGCDSFLAKPIDSKLLISKIQSLVNKKSESAVNKHIT